MIKLTKLNPKPSTPVDTTLTLPLQDRIRSRQRVKLDNGEDAGIFLERGTTMKAGDQLLCESGYRVEVRAANEQISVVSSDDSLLLARLCYHLGNRHVSLQIMSASVSYLHDHVLDDMVRGLGLEPECTMAPFEPESGAYGGSAEQGRNRSHHHGTGHGHHH